jgi:hypothetical protein
MHLNEVTIHRYVARAGLCSDISPDIFSLSSSLLPPATSEELQDCVLDVIESLKRLDVHTNTPIIGGLDLCHHLPGCHATKVSLQCELLALLYSATQRSVYLPAESVRIGFPKPTRFVIVRSVVAKIHT